MTNTSLYARAALKPLALLVLAAAVASGLTLALWLLPLGLLAYALLVYLTARDPALAAEASRPPRPQRPRLSSPTFKAQLAAIERTEQEIGRSAGQAQGPLARLLGPIADQARSLVEDAYALCGKGQIIESYLATVDLAMLQRDIGGLEAQLRSTADQYTRDQLAETLQARTDKLANARDLQTYIGRINAQLQNISASLDNVLAETVRLRTADAVSADTATNQVAGRLADLKADMDAFQAVLDTALTHTGP